MIVLENTLSPIDFPAQHQGQNGSSDHAPTLISCWSYKALIFHERFIYIFQRKQLTEGFQLHCTPMQCRLLVAFLHHPEQELSFRDLAAYAFRLDVSRCDLRDIVALQKHMSKLKQKLPPFLELVVVKGHGYVLRHCQDEPKESRNLAPE
ncbi:helix-turn-helix domain-containing protein [Ktedonobacter racemifer]|uniref:Transcriptional regulator domain protein n=1 Tax=Ktedonobacter racemifer DSM 44963 TaxID=485913 RepID=D6TGW5_KTERA|nr:helix-turn-helix domain-containing protein [Ktedonobacter racemifer]EFH88894.1 transcriptional regulator domain protein [Ktedonobacter racemifer DSM 44963]